MYDFNYQRATSVDDAASKYDAADDARYLAGGMTSWLEDELPFKGSLAGSSD